MEDRALAILGNYELSLLDSSKGRGMILCNTDCGMVAIQEYHAPIGKASLIDEIMHIVQNNGGIVVDEYLRNKDGELLSEDKDHKVYAVKKYYCGRECASKDAKDLSAAMRCLARMHLCLEKTSIHADKMQVFSPIDQMIRHNSEMNRVRSFIRGRQPKTDFEIALLKYYPMFEEQAISVKNRMAKTDFNCYYEKLAAKMQFAHGDYQYHNVQFLGEDPVVQNFEHCQWDGCIRDVVLMLRKAMEKSDWEEELGTRLLQEYETIRKLSRDEKMQIYYRLSYPEKFWKILNSYFNANKAFVSKQYMGKFETLLKQEDAKKHFLECIWKNL